MTIAKRKESWRQGETAFYSNRTQTEIEDQPVTVLGRHEPNVIINGSVQERVASGHQYVYMVRFGNGHITTVKEGDLLTNPHLKEDAPTNCAGGGAVAGIGIGPKGEPGRYVGNAVKKKKTADPEIVETILRRVLEGHK